MKLAVISHIKGKSSQSIVKEAKEFFDEADHLDIKKIEVQVARGSLEVNYDKKPLKNYDCIYIRGSYKYSLLNRSLTKALSHKTYMPINPSAFTVAHNKLLTLLELQKNSIRVPNTYFAVTSNVAKRVLKDIKYPVIIKVPEGGLGKGVMIADSDAAAKSMIDALELFKQPYILQEFIETGDKGASDLRIIVVGGKVVACMKRFAAKDDLRSNIHMEGKGIPCEVSPEVEQLAIRSAKLIGADICAIDVLEGAKPSVIEVNLSPGLQGIIKYTKINVAKKIAKFLFEETKLFKDKDKKDSDVRQILNGKINENYITLNIVNGMIKLPKFVTDLSGFTMDDDVIITTKKGEFVVKEHKIKKDY